MKGIYFMVNDKDYELFKTLKITIMREHRKIRGVLGHEIINLAYHNPNFAEKKEKSLKDTKVKKNTKIKLISLFNRLPNNGNIHEKLIDNLISEIFGMSEPTKRTYKNYMVSHFMIEESRMQPHIFCKGQLPPSLRTVKK